MSLQCLELVHKLQDVLLFHFSPFNVSCISKIACIFCETLLQLGSLLHKLKDTQCKLMKIMHTSPTSDNRLVAIVRSQTQTTEFVFFFIKKYGNVNITQK
jgi:hypothetical protein